ncbi:MAG: hypothetical protein LBH58_06800 [Tannerellaceae bacterium]|jgi:hypothetical protein|nr:hypothetical protein [Tannerellaceae bacterium]
MKKIILFLVALFTSAGLHFTLQAQQREGNVIKVQGHVHEVLTKQAAEGKLKAKSVKATTGTVTDIDPTDIDFLVGCVDENLPVDTAYLLVKWTDGKRTPAQGDSILLWGYRWNSTSGGFPVTKTTIDMIRAVANFDCRFSSLLQNTGAGNFTVGGFGYHHGVSNARVPVVFHFLQAAADPFVSFNYAETPNCVAGQYAVPSTPEDQAILALGVSANTGIIRHPFDASYSYPAYDYDHWSIAAGFDNVNNVWQAGWNNGYWAFYSKEGLVGDYGYAPAGVALRQLNNRSVDYFVFAPADFNVPVNLDGDYFVPELNCAPCADCFE